MVDDSDYTTEALTTFAELEENNYQNKSLGCTKHQGEDMVCECSYSPGEDEEEEACGEGSGCINRLTQIECLEDECRCGPFCQNQRFQKRQYANIDIIKTEKKGYGVRAASDLPADAFVYEYVGDVITNHTFLKRIREYADQGIRHFYFMLLQKDEFIDATKRGGKGRFLNHSCKPNCYVAKWVVGRKLRMGIFTKRDVAQGEELTFNYNVDRYGHDPQECFCGESNCVGYIGGKTQTDISGMDDLYLDALGITEEVEQLSLKGSKKKKGKKMDDDYIPILKPIVLKETPKVASGVRQSVNSRRILTKLLSRIRMTADGAVQKQLMRLHGFSLMNSVLDEWPADVDIILEVLQILSRWDLVAKNKLLSTSLESIIKKYISYESDPNLSQSATENPSTEAKWKQVKDLALSLDSIWSNLAVGYRIPKGIPRAPSPEPERWMSERKRQRTYDNAPVEWKRSRIDTTIIQKPPTPIIDYRAVQPPDLPPNWSYQRMPINGRLYFYHDFLRITRWEPPTPEEAALIEAEIIAHTKAATAQLPVNIDDVVAQAKAEEEAKNAQRAATAAPPAAQSINKVPPKEKEKHHSGPSKTLDRDKESSKEKRLYKVFGQVVVDTMSRYKGSFKDKEQFKRRAKEVTEILCSKEKKSPHYTTETYIDLTPEKEAKVKAFVKDWTKKLLARHSSSANRTTDGLNRSSETT
ncbi:SET domain-containing protein [Atractiella rhizophila]|nr:SET domain-containing protein [Atractiella rhizophila]